MSTNDIFDASSTDTGWIEPVLSVNWIDYPGEERFGYRRLNGIVYNKGIVRRNAAGGNNDAWAFLPAGFRPRITNSNGVAQHSVSVNGALNTLVIRNDGAIYLPNAAPGSGGYVLCGDIRPFPADA